ncbi:MAG: TRAP transporter large permease [Phycisphaerae bacterium]|nr:TRAP transporter large permease [Phycisphaerae bacterium]
MEGATLGITGIVVMLLGLFLPRIPAAFVMAMVGFVGLAWATSFQAALGIIGTEFWDIFSRYGLTVIPMFILVGEFIYYAGYSDQLYHATDRWVGHWRGGLAVTTVFASAGFSAICGSNTATAATMSAVALPSMKRLNYHPVLRTGAVAAGSTLGVMIPPSIVLVVYGLYTGQSIGKLFFGTLIPSAILTCLIALTVLGICIRHPDWGPKAAKTTWGEKFRALPKVLDIAVLFIVIMYALFTGVATPTEAAGTSCFLGLAICLIRRRLTWKGFVSAVKDTLRISCMVFMIVAGATVFGKFMTITRLPFEVANWIGTLNWPHWSILVMMLGCYVIGGCLMDALAFLLISLPIFYPLVVEMGYDPVWFGEVICLVTTLGAITPPIGICCYVIAGMAKDVRIEQVFKGALYYIPAYVVTVALVILFPYWTVTILAGLVP